jgi:hypothetical protein
MQSSPAGTGSWRERSSDLCRSRARGCRGYRRSRRQAMCRSSWFGCAWNSVRLASSQEGGTLAGGRPGDRPGACRGSLPFGRACRESPPASRRAAVAQHQPCAWHMYRAHWARRWHDVHGRLVATQHRLGQSVAGPCLHPSPRDVRIAYTCSRPWISSRS